METANMGEQAQHAFLYVTPDSFGQIWLLQTGSSNASTCYLSYGENTAFLGHKKSRCRTNLMSILNMALLSDTFVDCSSCESF